MSQPDPPFHHQALPPYSTLLAGAQPPDAVGFRSQRLQIWYNNTATSWVPPEGEPLHLHTTSDECFIVLQGALLVQVNTDLFWVRAGEFCCFPANVLHAVVQVETPAETFVIRAPSIQDKVYPHQPAPEPAQPTR